MSFLTDILPFIGTALGGPLGGMAASAVGEKLGIPAATVDTIKQVLGGMPPEKVAELKEADNNFQIKLAQMGYDSLEKITELNNSIILAVNTTMQVEAKAEHWPTYGWRPFIGFSFGAYISSLWLLPLFKVTPVMLSPDITMAIGAILGVASFFRGKAQADPNVQTPANITSKG